MEKRRATYDLAAIKKTIGSSETLAMTIGAFRDAEALGFERSEIAETIDGIERGMFFKSMTTFAIIVSGKMCIMCLHAAFCSTSNFRRI